MHDCTPRGRGCLRFVLLVRRVRRKLSFIEAHNEGLGIVFADGEDVQFQATTAATIGIVNDERWWHEPETSHLAVDVASPI